MCKFPLARKTDDVTNDGIIEVDQFGSNAEELFEYNRWYSVSELQKIGQVIDIVSSKRKF